MKQKTMSNIGSETNEVVNGIDEFERNLMKQGIKPHIDLEDNTELGNTTQTKTFIWKEQK